MPSIDCALVRDMAQSDLKNLSAPDFIKFVSPPEKFVFSIRQIARALSVIWQLRDANYSRVGPKNLRKRDKPNACFLADAHPGVYPESQCLQTFFYRWASNDYGVYVNRAR